MTETIVELGIDLEKNGSLIPKTAAQSITIRFDWDHTGAAVDFDVEVAIGHQSLMIDPFGKSFSSDGPQIPVSLTCPSDLSKKAYYYQLTEPLSDHYGSGETITDGAIRVVFKISGQPDRAAYLWKAFKISPAVVSFRTEINSDGAGQIMWCDRWMVYYYDPEAGVFVGDGEWHYLSTRVNFDYVKPGGYLAVYLLDSGTGQMSDQLTSDYWDIVDAHTYEYNPYTNRIIDIS